MTRQAMAAIILAVSAIVGPPLQAQEGAAVNDSTFGGETDFLKRHTPIVMLSSRDGRQQVAVAPAWQGRVMTSTAAGRGGQSFGWINHDLIASGKTGPHINAFGGEDRFWLGPEGGQFAFYFKPGDPFDLDHWQVPAAIDTDPFKLVSSASDRAVFVATFALTNASGTRFDMTVGREIRLLDARTGWRSLGVAPAGGVDMVAYESRNRLTNSGRAAWRRESGLPSIWILGMFEPAADAVIVVPLKPAAGGDGTAGVTSNYFGTIPPDRLAVMPRALFLKADGQSRGKIGLSPERSTGVLGSYDAARRLLTIVQFDQPADAADYVNSLWEHQANPYRGTAANAYNDGPPTPGAKQLGPFYELESSSPAAALAPGASIAHRHRTIHITGDPAVLDRIAQRLLSVSLADIRIAPADAAR